MFLKTCSALRSDNLDGVVKNVTNQHPVQETLTEFFENKDRFCILL